MTTRDWRIGRGWTDEELAAELATLPKRAFNFKAASITDESPLWRHDAVHVALGDERPGAPEPGGIFERACRLVEGYKFSDPNVVKAHFDPKAALHGRNMLLELHFMGLHFLSAVRVQNVRHDVVDGHDFYGFRYDTLERHVERGYEWFLVIKDRSSGKVTFEIQATWQLGDFPTWWSRVGFYLLGKHIRKTWQKRTGTLLLAGLATPTGHGTKMN